MSPLVLLYFSLILIDFFTKTADTNLFLFELVKGSRLVFLGAESPWYPKLGCRPYTG